MSRQKYQRPEGYATGKREKLWEGEWREHHLDAEGREQSRTGPRPGTVRISPTPKRKPSLTRCCATSNRAARSGMAR